MLMLHLLTVIAIFGLSAMTLAAKDTEEETVEKRQSHSCNVDGRIYRHGDVFTIGKPRCIKYRCNRGNYEIFQEGCDRFGQCWPAHQQFRYKCRDYMCYATTVSGRYRRYEVRPVGRQFCEDYRGVCRSPGERFSFVLNGRLRRDCTCHMSGAFNSYYCYD